MSVFKLGDKLALVFFIAVAEHLEGVGLGYVLADNGLVLACEFEHLGFDFGEVIGSEFVFSRVDVVVEAVFNGRADAEADAGVKLLKGLGEQVCRAVPESMLALGVIPFEELD